MTNPCIYLRDSNGKVIMGMRMLKSGITKFGKLWDVEATEEYANRPVPTEEEMTLILKKADLIENEYFRLRAKAIVGLAKIFGKRRIELSYLEMADIYVENGMLYITFTIAKKHKKGKSQYTEHLKRIGDLSLPLKTYSEIEAEWQEWTRTPEGIKTKIVKRPKMTPLTDKYALLILDYFQYVTEHYPDSKFLFPSGKALFGNCNLTKECANYMIFPDKSLSGRQILNIIKELDAQVWTHLFRKQKGTETAKKYGRTLEAVYMVKDTLDLSRVETAMHYIEENAPKLETGET
ncbi:MAG: hypothetical protein WC272_11365 [Sulfurimonas sp.]|jgi:integrase